MYYNQKEYAHISYPAKGYEAATVASSGCGVCCAAMVAEGLAGVSFPPEAAAALALQCGARVSGGTHMGRLGAALAQRFGLAVATADKGEALTACLMDGGWAIANVGGDRPGYVGLFSNSGHYVVIRGQEPDGRLIVWDPGYYAGKLDKTGRKGRATLRGNDILVAAAELESDCQSRSPRYYLFTAATQGPAPSPWACEAWGKAVAAGLLDGTAPQGALSREQLAVVLARLGLV